MPLRVVGADVITPLTVLPEELARRRQAGGCASDDRGAPASMQAATAQPRLKVAQGVVPAAGPQGGTAALVPGPAAPPPASTAPAALASASRAHPAARAPLLPSASCSAARAAPAALQAAQESLAPPKQVHHAHAAAAQFRPAPSTSRLAAGVRGPFSAQQSLPAPATLSQQGAVCSATARVQQPRGSAAAVQPAEPAARDRAHHCAVARAADTHTAPEAAPPAATSPGVAGAATMQPTGDNMAGAHRATPRPSDRASPLPGAAACAQDTPLDTRSVSSGVAHAAADASPPAPPARPRAAARLAQRTGLVQSLLERSRKRKALAATASTENSERGAADPAPLAPRHEPSNSQQVASHTSAQTAVPAHGILPGPTPKPRCVPAPSATEWPHSAFGSGASQPPRKRSRHDMLQQAAELLAHSSAASAPPLTGTASGGGLPGEAPTATQTRPKPDFAAAPDEPALGPQPLAPPPPPPSRWQAILMQKDLDRQRPASVTRVAAAPAVHDVDWSAFLQPEDAAPAPHVHGVSPDADSDQSRWATPPPPPHAPRLPASTSWATRAHHARPVERAAPTVTPPLLPQRRPRLQERAERACSALAPPQQLWAARREEQESAGAASANRAGRFSGGEEIVHKGMGLAALASPPPRKPQPTAQPIGAHSGPPRLSELLRQRFGGAAAAATAGERRAATRSKVAALLVTGPRSDARGAANEGVRSDLAPAPAQRADHEAAAPDVATSNVVRAQPADNDTAARSVAHTLDVLQPALVRDLHADHAPSSIHPVPNAGNLAAVERDQTPPAASTFAGDRVASAEQCTGAPGGALQPEWLSEAHAAAAPDGAATDVGADLASRRNALKNMLHVGVGAAPTEQPSTRTNGVAHGADGIMRPAPSDAQPAPAPPPGGVTDAQNVEKRRKLAEHLAALQALVKRPPSDAHTAPQAAVAPDHAGTAVAGEVLKDEEGQRVAAASQEAHGCVSVAPAAASSGRDAAESRQASDAKVDVAIHEPAVQLTDKAPRSCGDTAAAHAPPRGEAAAPDGATAMTGPASGAHAAAESGGAFAAASAAAECAAVSKPAALTRPALPSTRFVPVARRLDIGSGAKSSPAPNSGAAVNRDTATCAMGVPKLRRSFQVPRRPADA